MTLLNTKVLIVEDEVIIAESIKLYLTQMGCVDIKMAHDIHVAEQLIHSWDPSLVLLDIHLEQEDDGILLGAKLHDLQIPFMFITANTDNTTTQRVLETHPTGFISKPIRLNEFKINLHMLILQFEKNGKKKITLSNGSEQIQFTESQLKYLMSDGNYVEVHLVDNRYIIRSTLDRCMQEMNSKNVMRVHRSYIVSLEKIDRFSASFVEILGEMIPVSRSYQANLKEIVKKRG